MADLELVEKLLCERYNVRSLDGPLKEAIDAGDVAEVSRLVSERDMYRWHGAIRAALAEKPAHAEESDDGDGLESMTAAQLAAFADEHGIEIKARNKAEAIEQIRAGLSGEEEDEEDAEETEEE